MPRAPPRRRRKSSNCRCESVSVFSRSYNASFDDQNTSTPRSSSTSSTASWCELNHVPRQQTVTPTGSGVHLEKPPDKEWSDVAAADRSSSPTQAVVNNQRFRNGSGFHATDSETLESCETVPARTYTPRGSANGHVNKLPKTADGKCEIENGENGEKYAGGYNDADYGNNIFASWKEKRDFKQRVANTNNRNGFAFPAAVSETDPRFETYCVGTRSSHFVQQPTSGDVNSPSNSAFRKCEVDSDSDDYDDSGHVFATWKKKNGIFQQRISSRNPNQHQIGFHLHTSASEYVTTSAGPVHRHANGETNSTSVSTDKDCESERNESLLSFDDSADDDEDDIFALSKNRNNFYHYVVDGAWRGRPENRRCGNFDKGQNGACQRQFSSSIAAERDNIPMTSSTVTSGFDDDSDAENVSTPSGNGKPRGSLQHCTRGSKIY